MNRVFAIHTMGRVGSKTIAHSLFGQGYAAVHTHNFNPPSSPYEASTKHVLDFYRNFETDCWVISTVRDIVARNLSVYVDTHNRPSQFEFLREYPWNAAESWLSKEIVNYWGAPIFNQPFDKERGWTEYPSTQWRTHVLMVQLEKLDQEWPAIWEHITHGDFPVPVLERVIESNKPIYSRFNIPTTYLDKVYGGLVSQTFYSDEDIEIMRSKYEH